MVQGGADCGRGTFLAAGHRHKSRSARRNGDAHRRWCSREMAGGGGRGLTEAQSKFTQSRIAEMRVPTLARRQAVSLSSTALALLISSAGPLRAPAEAPAAAPEPPGLPETYPDPNKRDRGMMNEKVLVPRDYYGVFGVVPPRVLVQIDSKQPQWNAWGSCVDNSCARHAKTWRFRHGSNCRSFPILWPAGG